MEWWKQNPKTLASSDDDWPHYLMAGRHVCILILTVSELVRYFRWADTLL